MEFSQYVCDYIVQHFENDKAKILDVIEQCGIQILCRKILKEISPSKYLNCCILISEQKRRNRIIREEISVLLHHCMLKGVVPVFLKGFFLAEDLYDYEYERRSKDIDILIHEDEFMIYKDIFYDLGYTSDYFDTSTSLSVHMQELRIMHAEVYKIIEKYKVVIEIHISPINPPVTFHLSNEFKEDFEQKFLEGCPFYIYHNETNLVFLCLHFLKHIPCEYFEKILLQGTWMLNLSNLHDIALLINKYGMILDWKKVVYIAEKSRVTGFIKYVLQFVMDIYPVVIDKKTLDLFEIEKSADYIAAGSYESVGLGKFSILFCDMMDSWLNRPLACLLRGEVPEQVKLVTYAIYGDRSKPYYIDREYIYKFSSACGKNVGGHVEFIWESWGVKIQLFVHNKKLSFYCGEGDFYNKDSIELVLITEKISFIECIQYVLKEQKEELWNFRLTMIKRERIFCKGKSGS